MRQHTCTRRALLNGLRGLSGRLHCACASVLLAGIFNHQHPRRYIFVAFADFFSDAAQIFVALSAVFVFFSQVIDKAFPLQMARQWLASPFLSVRITAIASCRWIVVVLLLLIFWLSSFRSR